MSIGSCYKQQDACCSLMMGTLSIPLFHITNLKAIFTLLESAAACPIRYQRSFGAYTEDKYKFLLERIRSLITRVSLPARLDSPRFGEAGSSKRTGRQALLLKGRRSSNRVYFKHFSLYYNFSNISVVYNEKLQTHFSDRH